MAKKGKVSGIRDFNSIVSNFNRNIEDLLFYIIHTAPVLRELDGRSQEARGKLRDILKSIPSGSVDERVDISDETVEEAYTNIVGVLRDNVVLPWFERDQTELLFRTSFIILLSYFDYLISDIIHYHYRLHPDALAGKELTITLDDLRQCSDRDEAIELILEKKVESVLFRSLSGQLLFIEKDLAIDINRTAIRWDIVNEAIERRNLLVHNDGLVNRRYKRNVKGLVEGREGGELKLGDVLNVDRVYFKRVYDEILLAGVILANNCWRKWGGKDTFRAEESLARSLIKLLMRMEWGVAERLGAYVREVEIKNTHIKNDLTINYCVALKRLGRKKRLKKEFQGIDRGGLSLIRLALVSVLEDDKDGFYENIKKVAEEGVVHKESLLLPLDWPALDEIVKDVDYKDKIEKAFSGVS